MNAGEVSVPDQTYVCVCMCVCVCICVICMSDACMHICVCICVCESGRKDGGMDYLHLYDRISIPAK